MRRVIVITSSVLLLCGLIFSLSSVVRAQDDESATAGHRLVGTWIADTDPEDDSNSLNTFAFSSDGSYIDVESGDATLGSWEATGPTTANLTIVGFESDDEGTYLGSITIRASIEVSEDSNSFTAQYTIEFTDPEGVSAGEAGPGTATGTRLAVEAPGTPVMSMDELFGGLEGTPEATPEA